MIFVAHITKLLLALDGYILCKILHDCAVCDCVCMCISLILDCVPGNLVMVPDEHICNF